MCERQGSSITEVEKRNARGERTEELLCHVNTEQETLTDNVPSS